MNKIAKLLFLVLIAFSLSNCDQDGDGAGAAPLRDFQQQYNEDIIRIEEFLHTRSYTVIDHPGFADDQNVTFTLIPDGDTTMTSIWDSGDLLSRPYVDVAREVTYTIYYLKFRDGGGAADDKPAPTNVDGILAAYTGTYLFEAQNDSLVNGVTESVQRLKSHQFETSPFPQESRSLESVIKGWSEIFPQFRPGDFTEVNGEPTMYTDFGAGVMFLPSGLGYYNAAQTVIPQYSPLIFSFKLYEMTRLDQDQDGIPSYLEDDGDGYMYALPEGTINLDDTDGDLAPDYLDLDDDGDNVLTKVETRRPKLNPLDENEEYTYYPYNGAAIDDPLTPFDDTKGIPDCNGEFYLDRLRKYLDPACQ